MLKLFTAPQIRAWDAYTIKHTPITSLELMEHAAIAFVNWFTHKYNDQNSIHIICGSGNNGGDGFAISRLLSLKGYTVHTFLIDVKNKLSTDCKANYKRIKEVQKWQSIQKYNFNKDDIIIDAIFGSGLSRPVENEHAELIEAINSFNCIKVAVDVPSGLYCDQINCSDDAIFAADEVLTFQTPKRSFFFIENVKHLKKFTVTNISLHPIYYKQKHCNWFYIQEKCNAEELKRHEELPYNVKQFEQEYDVAFNTDKALALLTQKSILEQKIIHLHAFSDFYLTPEGNIYIILK